MTSVNTIRRLSEIDRAITEAAPAISPEEYRAFLFIAENDGASVKDVTTALQVPQSTVSRAVSNLNGSVPGQAKGFGLISAETDPVSRRKLRLHVTDRGHVLLARIAIILGCMLGSPGDDYLEPETLHYTQLESITSDAPPANSEAYSVVSLREPS